jgi:hypothetical protein
MMSDISFVQFQNLTVPGLVAQLSALTRHPMTALEFSWADAIPIEKIDLLSEWRRFTYRDAVLIVAAAQLVESRGGALADALQFVADRSAFDLYAAFQCKGAKDGFEFLLDGSLLGGIVPRLVGGVEVTGIEVAIDPTMERDILDNQPDADFWIASVGQRVMGGSSVDAVGWRVGDISVRAELSGTLSSIVTKISNMSRTTNVALSDIVMLNVSTAARCVHDRAERLGVEVTGNGFASNNLVVDLHK